MLMVVYGDLVLIMDGHGAILLQDIAPIQQWIGHGVCIWVLVVHVPAPLIVLVVRQLVLVVIRDITFARGFSSGFCFIAVFLTLR